MDPVKEAKLEKILEQVQKPSRYTGGEMNTAVKPKDKAEVSFAFCFPDTYEIGMSHLGMKILCHIINKLPWAVCERVFTPWVDMSALMRQEGVELFSLESRSPVREFDIVGFTLMYEMSFTNILEMLSLAGIPLRGADRGEKDPIVVAGGPCAYNPEPLAKFIDAFMIGDGEEVIQEVCEVIREHKRRGTSRQEVLRALSRLEGVYVPSLYTAEYHDDGTLKSLTPLEEGVPATVRRRVVPDLDGAEYPDTLPVPFTEIVFDRITLEIMRGCTRGCRFCQAGMIYRPVRERSVKTLLKQAEALEKSTGYEEISLSSLSSGDYTCLKELIESLMERFEDRRVSVSLPSMRIDNIVKQSLEETKRVKKSGLTLAPEAGTQRLRDVINKGVTEEDLVRSVTDAFEQGWSAVKLYFMLGLPTETDEDVLGIADLAEKVRKCYFSIPKERRAPGLRITVSASVFVPKNDTPFQWAGQLEYDEVVRRQQLLRQALSRIKGVDFKYHAPDISFIEAVFARGDRRLGEALERAWRLGCRFDGWSDQFRYDLWLRAFEETGIDPNFYATRERAVGEVFPWDHLDCGVTKQYLLREWEKARKGECTPDCRKGCTGCGMKRYEGACV